MRLGDFLHDQSLTLKDVYRVSTGQGRSGWTALQHDAGLMVAKPGPEEHYSSRRLGDLLRVDDSRRLKVMACTVQGTGASAATNTAQPLGMQTLADQIDGRNE